MLTTHLLFQNHQETVRKAVESVQGLGAVVAGDLGHQDRTGALLRSLGVRQQTAPADDISKARNGLLSGGWNFYLQPWEILIAGREAIQEITNGPPAAHYVQVIEGDVATKQVRLWCDPDLRFRNPVYERLDCQQASPSNIVIWSGKGCFAAEKQILDRWAAEKPLDPEPVYCLACYHLGRREYDQFLRLAGRFLFMTSEESMQAIMTRYYCGVVHCYVKKAPEEAARNALACLAVRPLMAEFWCLLGDIFVQANMPVSAAIFYQNAIELGGQRPEDEWPVILSKYKKYPEEMRAKCLAQADSGSSITTVT